MNLRLAFVLSVAVALSLGWTPAQAGTFEQHAQRRLNELGCNAGPADGRIGEWTRTGIIRFQSANGLEQSGRLTKATRSRMYAERQLRCDRRPVVRSGTGRRVVISQRQNYVWLVRDDGSVRAQGGLIDNPDVVRPGTYTVGSKCGRQAKILHNIDYSGRLWLHHFTRFAPCGVGFHQVPVDKSSGQQIHPDWYLGTNRKVSSGCVRLSRTMSIRLWDFATIGTRVVVR